MNRARILIAALIAVTAAACGPSIPPKGIVLSHHFEAAYTTPGYDDSGYKYEYNYTTGKYDYHYVSDYVEAVHHPAVWQLTIRSTNTDDRGEKDTIDVDETTFMACKNGMRFNDYTCQLG